MSAPTPCGWCPVVWHQAGNRTGHCSKCHRTFSGISTFDAHQTAEGCQDPASLTEKRTGEPRFRTFVDACGATVWRSAKERPLNSWGPAREALR